MAHRFYHPRASAEGQGTAILQRHDRWAVVHRPRPQDRKQAVDRRERLSAAWIDISDELIEERACGRSIQQPDIHDVRNTLVGICLAGSESYPKTSC